MNKYLVTAYITIEYQDVEKYAIVEAKNESEAIQLFESEFSYSKLKAEQVHLLSFNNVSGVICSN